MEEQFKWFTMRENWQQKAVTEAEKKAQEARSRRYGIRILTGGNVTKPTKYAAVVDDKFADPVNYRYPLVPQVRATNAITRFNAPGNKAAGGYNNEEWAKMGVRIAKANGGSDKGYRYEKGRVLTPGTVPKEGD